MKKGKQFIKIHKNLGLFLGIIFILFVTPILFFSIFIINFYLRIYPNVYIGTVNVGSLTEEQATQKIKDQYPLSESITITATGVTKQSQITPKDIELSYPTSDAVEEAYKVGRTGAFISDLAKIISSFIQKSDIKFEATYNRSKLENILSSINDQISTPPQPPSYSIESGKVKIFVGEKGQLLDVENSKRQIIDAFEMKQSNLNLIPVVSDPTLTADGYLTAEKRISNLGEALIKVEVDDYKQDITKKTIVTLLNPKGGYFKNKVDELTASIVKAINREAQDPIFKFENERVKEFSPAHDGLTVDTESFTQKIYNTLALIEDGKTTQSIEVPVTRTKPSRQTSDVNNLGIKEVLGVGTSKFAGSISSRLHNVALAASRINGVLVAPNETFSFAKAIGDVSKYTGYKEAYIIQNGRTILGDGGGVCQVSTTLFRAVMSAGLPIVERHPHAYRVGYYEQDAPAGYDATVYVPSVDFKFKNDTGNYILIQTKVNTQNQTAEFTVFGTKDGRTSTITKPVLTNQVAPPEDLYVDDPTLPTGKVNQVEHKAWGATSTFTYTVKRNGEDIYSKKFVSVYQPWQAVYMKGTGSF